MVVTSAGGLGNTLYHKCLHGAVSRPQAMFFILWPLKYVFATPPLMFGTALIDGSEVLKVSTVAYWHRSLGKSYNKALQTDA